jgi:hypothetical protein
MGQNGLKTGNFYNCNALSFFRIEQFKRAMSEFAACPGVSLRMCVSEQHINLLRSIDPTCPVPSSSNTIKNWLFQTSSQVHSSLKEELQYFRGFLSATVDLWTDPMMLRCYAGISLHFVDGPHLIIRRIGVSKLDGDHTAKNIKACVQKKLREFGLIYDDIYAVITDNGANIIKAFQLEGKGLIYMQ